MLDFIGMTLTAALMTVVVNALITFMSSALLGSNFSSLPESPYMIVRT